jgi:hypothetical protein
MDGIHGSWGGFCHVAQERKREKEIKSLENKKVKKKAVIHSREQPRLLLHAPSAGLGFHPFPGLEVITRGGGSPPIKNYIIVH